MKFVEWLAWLLIVVPILPFSAAAVFVWSRFWRYTSPSLRERAIIAIRDWIVASAVAAVALNLVLNLGWPGEVRALLLAGAMILVSVPSAYWLTLYFGGRFRER